MSVVTTATAVPSRLLAIYGALCGSESGEARAHLEAIATPPSLDRKGGDDEDQGEGNTTLFSHTLNEAKRLQMVHEADGQLTLSSEARGDWRKRDDTERCFKQFLYRTLFDPHLAKKTQHTGWGLALSWFLSTSPLRPLSFSTAPIDALKAEFGARYTETEITSNSSYQNFLYWARYLGFASIVGDQLGQRRVLADPTRAIERALPTIFAEARQMPADSFFIRLAQIYPVFETGSMREQLDGLRLTPPQDSERRVTIATSLALQRLVDRKRLLLSPIADAASRVFDFGVREVRYAQVAIQGAK